MSLCDGYRAALGNGASPPSNWHVLYESAVLELDGEKILVRIGEAERAVMERLEALKGSGDGLESEALVNALNVLCDLRKMKADR